MKIEQLKRRLPNAPEVTFSNVEKTGSFPTGAFLNSNLVEFFHRGGDWHLPLQPRMDGVTRLEGDNFRVVEMNKLKEGEKVVFGDTDDGSQGIYIANLPPAADDDAFGFMTNNISRERRVFYPKLAQLLKAAKEGTGKIIWVLGPAVVHAGGVESMAWLIRNGYVGALFGGNAVGTHDIEENLKGTSLGISKIDGRPVHNGHRNHLEAVNAIREAGSISAAVKSGLLTGGIMYECVQNNVPFVLAGSIRDDGPLPDVITDALQAQNAMRAHTIDASAVVTIASVLHSVATGNMTPTYRVVGDEIVTIPMIAVDIEEFPVSKLVDRGTTQASSVVANAADFLNSIVNELAK